MASRVSLVNLQKFTFWRMRRFAEHADIGAGAEHIVLAGLDDDRAHFRMLEAQPLHRVVEFDIDAEVVGVELEFVAVEQPAGLIDVHDQIGDVAVALDAPVAVARRLGLEIDGLHDQTGAGLEAVRRPSPFMHYFAYY